MTDAPALDPSQRAVLELPADASAVVLGAPGSGKTTTAVALVADRVRSGLLLPSQVLLLAPRRAQAGRLRDRLLLACGVPVTAPLARTPASLAFDVARRRALAAGDPEPGLVTGAEQDARITDLMEHADVAWPLRLDADVRGMRAFRDELRELWARCVERDVDPQALAAIGERRGRPDWVAAARFWAQYRENLEWTGGADRFDAAELAALATAAVLRGEGGATASALRLVVVDDLQDMGEAAVGLLGALASRGCSVVAFGDPDVAADTFRGGEPDLPGRLGAAIAVGPVTRLRLATVHRHETAIRGFVSQVTQRIGAALAGPHRVAAARPGGTPVRTVTGAGDAELAARIAHLLRAAHLTHDVPYADQAVIVRSNALVAPLARALEVAGVPTSTAAAAVGPADRAPRALLETVAVALGERPLTPDTAAQLLTGPVCGLDTLGLRRLRLALRVEELDGGGARGPGELLVEALGGPERLATVDGPAARSARRLAGTLADVRAQAATGASAEELLWRVWHDSGLAPVWRASALGDGIAAAEANRDLDGVVALFAAAAREAERNPDEPASQFVVRMLGADVADDSLAPRGRRDGVLVTTPAGVAGLEFDTVVIAGLQDGVWPNLRPRGSLLGLGDLVALLDGRQPPASVSIESVSVKSVSGESVSAESVSAESVSGERRALLSDELRLFALAAARARRTLLLAAVANEDESPSILFGLGDGPVPQPADDAPNALRPFVGHLRHTLVNGDPAARVDAAAALARLAAADVAGAAPASWWGLAEPSTRDPLVPDPAAPVPVSPSGLDRWLESPLDWFADHVAGGRPTLSSALGTVLHHVLETATAPDEALLGAALDADWRHLDFEARWVADRERRIAAQMITAIATYLRQRAAAGTTLLGGETPFTLAVGRAAVAGRIDRVERDAAGRVRVVDLKTGRTKVAVKDLPANPQLGVYQLAVAAGAVAGVPAGAASAGAALLYVRATDGRPVERQQDALDDASAQAFRDLVAEAAEGMAGATFPGPVEPEERHGTGELRRLLLRIPEVCGG